MEERFNANVAIDRFILGSEFPNWKHRYIDDNAVPYCNIEKREICSPVMPVAVNPEIDNIIRAKNEHEAGHARFTPYGKDCNWDSLKGNLVNSLEDLRIEKGLKTLSPVFKTDLEHLNKTIIQKQQNAFKCGNYSEIKPLNEALMALHYTGNGFPPEWEMSTTAKAYYDVALPIFKEWELADCTSKDGFAKIEEIADKIIAKWNELKQNAQNSTESGEDGESSEGEDEQSESNEESKSNKSNKSNKSKSKSNTSKDKDGDSSEESTESQEGNKQDGQGESQEESNGDETTENANEDEDGQSTESNDEEDGQGESNESNATTDQQSESSKNGKESKKSTPKKSTESKEQKNVPHDKTTNPNGGNGVVNDTTIDLNEDFENKDYDEQALNDELKKAFEESKSVYGDYKPYTAEDQTNLADENKVSFDNARAQINGKTSILASYLGQSLKTLSRCRTIGNRDKGSLNVQRNATNICKSLTKNLFEKQIKGLSLDTTVSILLDESGSIGYHISAEYRKIAIAFAEVLDQLGIDFEILGHTTGYHPRNISTTDLAKFTRQSTMRIYEHKRLNVPYRKERYRLGSITSSNCNLDGEALLETYKRNSSKRSQRHVIFVFSDGCPNDCDTLHSILYKNLTDTIKYIRKNGTEVYAFGIGTQEPEKFYGKDNFIYLQSVDDMTSGFFHKVAEVITNGNRK